MAKKFSKLRAGMSADAQVKAQAKAQAMLQEMPLQELRLARGLSQQTLAEVLQVQQPAIAKMEKRTDMYLSTLRNHIRAMGGELDIIARFPDGEVRIQNFAEPDEEPLTHSA
ncbi:XRE family transcriptional regulator [Nitrosococcus oceani]|uniref:XRE family transcriptional regulator n=1 Tax=Nitrosococcus oceani TaxID=1229 RepID=UPI0004E89886|nr:XRE family transcriptional regulator [Nitrosococcus oceani]KFI23727.1 transcriptional regulator [Nitrosococcus oceani]